VLAYDYAAAGALIRSGVNGLLAPFDVEPRLVEMAATLARDPSPLPELGRRARETACAMGWDRIAEQVESVFAATISDAPLSRRLAGLHAPAPAP
jgi:hypothetical protein